MKVSATDVTDSEGNTTQAPINVSDDDIDWLTVNMLEEAASEGNDGMAAVAQVFAEREAWGRTPPPRRAGKRAATGA